jgi:hypothetical protein
MGASVPNALTTCQHHITVSYFYFIQGSDDLSIMPAGSLSGYGGANICWQMNFVCNKMHGSKVKSSSCQEYDSEYCILRFTKLLEIECVVNFKRRPIY